MALVTLEQARRHLKIPASGSPPTSEHDAEIHDLLTRAEELVIDWVGQRRMDGAAWAAECATWDIDASPPLPPPKRVEQAVLVQLGELWRFRGDDFETERPKPELGELARGVTALLYRLRDPSLS
jgi:hypothetical protein